MCHGTWLLYATHSPRPFHHLQGFAVINEAISMSSCKCSGHCFRGINIVAQVRAFQEANVRLIPDQKAEDVLPKDFARLLPADVQLADGASHR